MSAAARAVVTVGATGTQEVTLLELVSAISEAAENDATGHSRWVFCHARRHAGAADSVTG